MSNFNKEQNLENSLLTHFAEHHRLCVYMAFVEEVKWHKVGSVQERVDQNSFRRQVGIMMKMVNFSFYSTYVHKCTTALLTQNSSPYPLSLKGV